MDFGEVLGRAWRIIWKHKILWIFGIFAGCAQGGGGGGGNGARMTTPSGGPTGPGPFPQLEQNAAQLSDWISSHPWVVVLFVIILLVIILLALWLGTMGRIGLIKGTSKAEAGAERMGFGELWSESTPFFWRVFLLSLLVGLAFLVVLLPIIGLAILFSAVTLGVGLLCLIPFFCLLVPAAIAVGLWVQLSEPAIVLENLGIVDGLRRGWEVFKRNVGPVLLIWLILAVIGFLVAILIALPVLVVVLPAVFAFAFSNTQGANIAWTPLIVAGLCLVAYFPVLLVLRGILTSYVQTAWTLTYMRLSRPKEVVETPVIPAPNA